MARNRHRLALPDDDTVADMYFDSIDLLASRGYDQYEISNFAREGYACRHNIRYWQPGEYLGLGPGAASRLPNRFYFNTFDNRAYQQRLAERRFPTALGMTLSERLSNWYWLYWRFYETRLPVAEIERRFAAEWAWPPLRKSLDVLHWWEPDGEMRRLTLEGAFWIHLLQNGYILNDIDQVWSSCRREAFPAAIRL